MVKPQKNSITKKQLMITENAIAKPALESSFLEVVEMIQQARQQVFQVVNTTLIDLYWHVGELYQSQSRNSHLG